MSFRDDFFEALRSVKNDFLGDSGSAAAGPSRPEAHAAEQLYPARAEPAEPLVTEGGPVANDTPAAAQQAVDDSIESRMDAEFDSDGDQPYQEPDESLHNRFDSFEETAPFHNDHTYESSNISMDSRKMFDFSARDGIYEDDKTIISRNTVITGALQTEDSIRMLGQVMGNIDCKSNIVVAGKVRGNTSAANAFLIDAQIDGNLLCDDAINISSDTWILGNIRAQQAEVDGKVKGNLEIRHNISVGSTSSIIGNISTDELEIKKGAFINGQIIMYSPAKDVLDRFDTFE